MTKITNSNGVIECTGHAGDKIPCAMLTALSVALLSNLEERLDEHPASKLEPGYFRIDIEGLSERAVDLVESYWFAVHGLARSYPTHFEVSD